jgi:hypothetical protein
VALNDSSGMFALTVAIGGNSGLDMLNARLSQDDPERPFDCDDLGQILDVGGSVGAIYAHHLVMSGPDAVRGRSGAAGENARVTQAV